MVITGDQIRMARAALRLTVREVAELTGIDKSTIIRAEAGGKVFYQTMTKLQAALEAEGVEFIEAIEGKRGPGVALRWDIDPSKRVRRTSTGDDAGEGGSHQAADPDLVDFMSSAIWAEISEDGREAIAQAASGE